MDLDDRAVVGLDDGRRALRPRRRHGDEPRGRELEDPARHLELELADAPPDLGDAPATVALREELDELRGRLAAARRDGHRDPRVARDLLAKEAQLVHAPRRLHEQLPGAQVIPARDARLVEAVEEVEHRLRDVHGAVEDLLDLARHHAKELVGAHELELDGRLAHALALALGRAHDLLELVARDGSEAPEDLAQALGRRRRRRADDLTALEEDRSRRVLVQHDELPAPAACATSATTSQRAPGARTSPASRSGRPDSPDRTARTTSGGLRRSDHSPTRARRAWLASRPTGWTVPVLSTRRSPRRSLPGSSPIVQRIPIFGQPRMAKPRPRLYAARSPRAASRTPTPARNERARTTPTSSTRKLASVGYLASDELAVAAWLALALERPLLVEGPAGVGKTDLARALAEALGRELVRLQCYEGLDEAKALYEWDYAKQMLYTQLLREAAWPRRPRAPRRWPRPPIAWRAPTRRSSAGASSSSDRSCARCRARRPWSCSSTRSTARTPSSRRFCSRSWPSARRPSPSSGTVARQERAALRPDEQRDARDERRAAPPLPARVRRLSAAVARAGDPRAPRPRARAAPRRAAHRVRPRGAGAGPAQGAVDRRVDRLGARARPARRGRPRRDSRPLDARRLAQARGRPREGRADPGEARRSGARGDPRETGGSSAWWSARARR